MPAEPVRPSWRRVAAGSGTATLTTARLLLRDWRDADREAFAEMNADPEVMRYFAAPLSRVESDAMVERMRSHHDERGWGLWAVELAATGVFIGFVGLAVPRHALPFMPCVEIGWRLARAHWHQGYATEGARAALDFGFGVLGLEEIVSFTALGNRPSRAVMERLGMVDANEDFDHPGLPAGHALRRHCLYRLRRPAASDADARRA